MNEQSQTYACQPRPIRHTTGPALPVAAAAGTGGRITQWYISDTDGRQRPCGVPFRFRNAPRVALKNFSRSDVWSFEHLGNDYYKVTEQSYHLVLDSFRSEKYNGVPAITFPWHGGKNQRWKVIRKGEFYSLICQETGLALDLKNNQQKVGGVFQGYTANGSRGQLFRLTLASEAQPQREQPQKPADNQVKSFSNGPTAQ